MLRRRTSGLMDDDSDSDSADLEENIRAAHPDPKGFLIKLPLFAQQRDRQLGDDSHVGLFYKILRDLAEGKLWWAKCFSIFVAATLTYTFKNANPVKTNVQIAIMTVITLVAASPFASTQVIPAAIGAFVGGQNIIGSTGLFEENTEIRPINYVLLLQLSIVVGLCFVVFVQRKILDGYAGRLGTTTFLGMNITMVSIYGPLGVVDWDRYYYGFNHLVHVGEEDSALDWAKAWSWTEEAELAIGYVWAVIWLGWISGVTRILHNEYIQRWSDTFDSIPVSSATPSASASPPPAPLNNVSVPVLWALFSMLVVNATEYRHASGLYNGFAVGSYVGMASLQKIPSISRFTVVSLLAAIWGLALTPVFVGFAGKSGFTAMLGHVTYAMIDSAVVERLRGCRSTSSQQLFEEAIGDDEQTPQRLQRQESQGLVEDRDSKEEGAKDDDALMLKPELKVSRKYIKPKEPFLTKQQRRQQQRMKHIQQQQQKQKQKLEKTETAMMMNDGQATNSDAPKLHHRAWSTAMGNDPWQHPMEDPNQPNTEQRHNVV